MDSELSPAKQQMLAAVAFALAKDLPPEDPLRKQLLIEAKAVLDAAARPRDELGRELINT